MGLTLKYGEWELEAETLIPKSMAYLLQNGFSQSMTDAAAFTREQKAKFEAEGKTVEEAAQEAREKRFAAIVKGEVGVRVGGPRKSPLERAYDEAAKAKLAAMCEAKGFAVPKGDKYKSYLEKVKKTFHEQLTREAEKRVADAKSAVDVIDSIFDDGDEGTAEAAE